MADGMWTRKLFARSAAVLAVQSIARGTTCGGKKIFKFARTYDRTSRARKVRKHLPDSTLQPHAYPTGKV
jgi:hypothetical protein